eukprot:scaffold24414_cov39-Cyclotella_meneghiniana.AAC.2
MDLIFQATHKSGQNNSWVSLVSHNSDNTSYILSSYKNSTYKDDGDNDESIAGSIQSIDTLPYDLDLCQLIDTDTHKKNWRKTLLTKLGGNAH